MKILILTGDYAENHELFFSYYYLIAQGFSVAVASPQRQMAAPIKTVVHHVQPNEGTYHELAANPFYLTADFEPEALAACDALFIPGGRAVEYLRLNPRVRRLLQTFAEKPIGCIGLGALLLLAADLLAGKKVCAYPTAMLDVTRAGAIYQDVPFNYAVRDGNLVSAPSALALPTCLPLFVEVLNAL